MIDPGTIARLRELLAKATPGEWLATPFNDIQRTNADGRPGSLIAATSGRYGAWDGWVENAQAIAAAVNFLRSNDFTALLALADAVNNAGFAEVRENWQLDNIIGPDLRGKLVRLVPFPEGV